MAEKFKINDLVEVIMWEGKQRQNWIVVGFASDGSEAVLRKIPTGIQAIVMLENLKLQIKENPNEISMV